MGELPFKGLQGLQEVSAGESWLFGVISYNGNKQHLFPSHHSPLVGISLDCWQCSITQCDTPVLQWMAKLDVSQLYSNLCSHLRISEIPQGVVTYIPAVLTPATGIKI